MAVEFCGCGFLFEGRLSSRQPCYGDAKWRAAYVGQACLVTEFDTGGIAAVFATNPKLDVRASYPALFYRDLYQLADTGLINRCERVGFYNLKLGIGRQEAA